MRIEYSKDDLKSLNFNYIVQVGQHKHQDCIFDCPNPMFWIEKRIKFVVAHDGKGKSCALQGYYYGLETFTTRGLVERLNKSEGRYYRLLNAKELEWFNNWLQIQRA